MTETDKKAKKFDKLLNWLLIAMLLYYGYRYSGLLFPSTRVNDPAKAQAILYATRWCPFCIEARGYFAQNGIRYFEYDINHSPEGQTRFQQLGGKAVPLIVIGKVKIYGMHRGKIQQALKQLNSQF